VKTENYFNDMKEYYRKLAEPKYDLGEKVNWIVIDGGHTFEGTFAQFEDCFFSSATVEGIKNWAEQKEMKVEFVNNPSEKVLTSWKVLK
jgi:hypothetical protein